MAAIREDVRAGRNGSSAHRLASYLASHPDSDEALYLLVASDMALGLNRAADEAWAKVPPDSRFTGRAILGRMQIRLGRGQPAEAERLVRESLDDPRVDGNGPAILLGPILCQQGRFGEAEQIIASRWERLERTGQGASEPAIQLLRLYIELRRQPAPIDATRRRARPGGEPGYRRRSRLAGQGQPGDPGGRSGRGRPLDLGLPPSPSGRHPSLRAPGWTGRSRPGVRRRPRPR